MLYKMLEKVNDDRQRRIKEKNNQLMKKIKRMERKRQAIERGEEVPESDDDELDEIQYEQ